MALTVHEYLAADHDRIDGWLQLACAEPGIIDRVAYAEFRKGLLRHIAMEEKVLFPALERLNGERLPVLDRLHLDHGALVALLVPPPSLEVVSTIQSILSGHNLLEEEETGVYRLLDRLSGDDGAEVLEALQRTPEVPVQPHNTKPEVLDATRRAVERAGYRFPSA